MLDGFTAGKCSIGGGSNFQSIPPDTQPVAPSRKICRRGFVSPRQSFVHRSLAVHHRGSGDPVSVYAAACGSFWVLGIVNHSVDDGCVVFTDGYHEFT